MRIPSILHMIWVGDKTPPKYFWDNLNGWKELMPDWTFMVWTNEVLTEKVIGSQHKDFLNLLGRCRNGAQKADLLSYFAIERFGGYFMDADVIPIRSLDELDTEGKEVILCHDLPEVSWNFVSAGFFGSVPHHPLFQNLVKNANQIDLTDPDQQVTTGPGYLGKEWSKIDWAKNGGYLMLPYWAFYRNRVGDPGPYMPDRIMQDHPDAFGNHFYAAEWIKPQKGEFEIENIKDKIAIGIRGCINGEWTSNWQECLDTWAGYMIKNGWRVKVHIGHPELEEEYKDLGDFFVSKTSDNKYGVFHKSVYYPAKWLVEQKKYTHIFVTDSDTFIHPSRFESTLHKLNEIHGYLDYVGSFRMVPIPDSLQPDMNYSVKMDMNAGHPEYPDYKVYASGGSGFLLSKKSAYEIIKAVESGEYKKYSNYNDEWLFYDDLLLGEILKVANIPLIYSTAFQSTSPKINDLPNYTPPGIETEEGSHICVQHYRKGDMSMIMDLCKLK